MNFSRMTLIVTAVIVLLILLIGSLIFIKPSLVQKSVVAPTEMNLTSPAFANNQSIPSQYTCDGENVSPPLEISAVPQQAQSLVLIVDDPDAPAGDWVHWTLWNIDPQTISIPENTIPEGAVEGMTDFDQLGYGGPCPPSGTHRYQFKLYALDTKLDLSLEAKKQDIEQIMQGHILSQTQLTGLYQRE